MKRLVIYRKILEDTRINLLMQLVGNQNPEQIEHIYYELCSLTVNNHGISLKKQIADLILTDENVFARAAEKGEKISDQVRKAVLNDINIFKELFSMNFSSISKIAGDPHTLLDDGLSDNMVNVLTNSSPSEILDMLYDMYNKEGCGIFRQYHAFAVNENLQITPVLSFRPLELSDLYGYEDQKNDIKNNTKRLVSGLPAHNILLFGDSGTGKSTTVKAMLPLFHNQKLRLIEVDKDKLHALQGLVSSLSERGLFFIIFIDDLSFEHDDEEYKFLKTVIQGGLYEGTGNIRFYVTSNRRNIVKQNMQARENEVNVNDFLNETVSLTDRFGMKIYFDKPTKTEFLEIVRFLAGAYHMEYTDETEKAALKFAFFNGGYNGRSARQFMDSITTV